MIAKCCEKHYWRNWVGTVKIWRTWRKRFFPEQRLCTGHEVDVLPLCVELARIRVAYTRIRYNIAEELDLFLLPFQSTRHWTGEYSHLNSFKTVIHQQHRQNTAPLCQHVSHIDRSQSSTSIDVIAKYFKLKKSYPRKLRWQPCARRSGSLSGTIRYHVFD